MALPTTASAHRPWGVIETDPTVGPESPPADGLFRDLPSEHLHWLPPADISHQLPSDFRLYLQCLAFPDGLRRFYPPGGWDRFVADAFTGGLALLDRNYGLGTAGRASY